MPERVTVDRIVGNINWGDDSSFRLAAKKMKKVSHYDLHLFLVMRDTLNATTAETRKKIALAQAEVDRRRESQAQKLTITSTGLSGVLAILGVVIGVLLERHLLGV